MCDDGGGGCCDRLEPYRLRDAPASLYLLPDFVTAGEESSLVAGVLAAPRPKWRQLNGRRVQNWGGAVGKRSLVPCDDIPKWLADCITRLVERGVLPAERRPNHVLVNEYLPGQGIMPHTDGGAFHPVVATLTLGAHAVMDLRPRRPPSPPSDCDGESAPPPAVLGSVYLPPRSLVVLAERCYTELMHGIDAVTEDTLHQGNVWNWDTARRCVGDQDQVDDADGCVTVHRLATRYSLTMRHVPRVLKLFG